MLSKSRIQFISSLQTSKYRGVNRRFIAEGPKLIHELLQSNFIIDSIYATPEWINDSESEIKSRVAIIPVSLKELERISALKTPNQVLAVINIPDQFAELPDASGQLILLLDGISDPGNMGTIIRTAEWFGIRNLICSENCADIYNPKVVQATMGSILRVNIFYKNLKEYLCALFETTPVYGALLNGKDIYNTDLTDNGVIMIGNESHGISPELVPLIKIKIKIPDYSCQGSKSAESLNASIAAAIVLGEFRRRMNS
jgi:RNA methyltransferase, TrmH family